MERRQKSREDEEQIVKIGGKMSNRKREVVKIEVSDKDETSVTKIRDQ